MTEVWNDKRRIKWRSENAEQCHDAFSEFFSANTRVAAAEKEPPNHLEKVIVRIGRLLGGAGASAADGRKDGIERSTLN